MGYLYFDIQHAIVVHDQIIEKSGGLKGLINIGLLESTLEHIQNDIYYPSLEDKVTHLLYSINKNHSFQDGNKRSSLALAAYFLQINGLGILVNNFIIAMENYVVDIADNIIDKELLLKIVTSLVFDGELSDIIKLEIYRAKVANL